MKIYLVGGAVRDLLLKRKISDKDYVVVGSSADEMLSLGFKSVGKFFPVFIHAEKEGEYALARVEKKSGKKHFDFKCFTENVSLKEDLKRRDLTINAIAYDESKNEFIDYFGGIEDIKNRILRPVSEAFKEDPLRILRAARIRTQLGSEWAFDELLIKYSSEIKNDIKYISKERIYQETKKALRSKKSSVYFISLLELGVLENVFASIFESETKNAKMEFERTMASLDLCEDINAKWAVLLQNLGSLPKDEFEKIKNELTLNRNEFKIVLFFAQNRYKLQDLFLNKLESLKIAKLLFSVKNKQNLRSLLLAAEANIKSESVKKPFFTKKQIETLWEILINTDYEIDKKMEIEKIKNKIADKQKKITEDFIKTEFGNCDKLVAGGGFEPPTSGL